MSAMTDASKKIIMALLDEQITSLEEDTQAYAQLTQAAASVADHISLSIIEEVDPKWLLAVVGVLGQIKPEGHLEYLKRAMEASTIEEVDPKWLLAVVGVLGQIKPEGHLEYLKRAMEASTPQVMDDMKKIMYVSMNTTLGMEPIH